VREESNNGTTEDGPIAIVECCYTGGVDDVCVFTDVEQRVQVSAVSSWVSPGDVQTD